MPFLNIDWAFAFGELNRNPDQPLVLQRACRAIAEDGRPQTAPSLVLLQPHRERQEVCWFGVFVLSQGERVVFFLPYEATGFDFLDGRTNHALGGYPVDHITLAVDRHRWHFTGTDPERHTGGPRTVPLTGGGDLCSELPLQAWSAFPSYGKPTWSGFLCPIPTEIAELNSCSQFETKPAI
jgi:hypothetical protein